MKKGIIAIGAILLSGWTAAAQDVPRMETFLGYTYTRFNSAGAVPAFSMNGAGGQFGYNFNKWLSGVADIGAVHNGNIGGYHLDTTLTNFLFGPRVSLRYSRLTPYFNTLFGVVYGTSSTQVTLLAPTPLGPTPLIATGLPGQPIIPGQPITTRLVGSQTAFGMVAGGGLDIKLTKNLSFRPIGLDYYLTRLHNFVQQDDKNQNCLRYTAGVNFTFGAQ